MYCPLEIVESFIRLADANTKKFVETCAILAGNEKNGALIIDTLIIPQQKGAHDHCYMTDEIELFQTQIENNVMTLGWIHTHPQYVRRRSVISYSRSSSLRLICTISSDTRCRCLRQWPLCIRLWSRFATRPSGSRMRECLR